jgi:hypothetical protein
MNDYITLLGAEQVQSAANTMRSAADTMGCAVNNLDSMMERNHRFMNDWLQRFEDVVVRGQT